MAAGFSLELGQHPQFLYKQGVTFHFGVQGAKSHPEVPDSYMHQGYDRDRLAAVVLFTAKIVTVLVAGSTRIIFAARGFIFTSAFTLATRVYIAP